MILPNIYKGITQFFAPAFCAYCKTFLDKETVFCNVCLLQIQPIVSGQLAITARRSIPVFAVGEYKGPLKRLILAKQWSNYLASVQMADIIWQRALLQSFECNVFVPVPLHWTRFIWRGYNQAAVMASRLSELSKIPVGKALVRKRKTRVQFELKGDDRTENVKNAFYVKDSVMHTIKGRHVVLVDDLMTTGATLKYAAKALFLCKPASITAVVTCRVI